MLRSVFKAFSHAILILSSLSANVGISAGRSPNRPHSPSAPQIEISWADGSGTKTRLADSHIEYYPTFAFNQSTFDGHGLPLDNIEHRNSPNSYSSGKELTNLIEQLLEQIESGERVFKHFQVLQRKNFSYHRQCGLLVLRFKDHPFVVKLFMEQPNTFFSPYCKGIEQISFFFMGSTNRHLSGMGRIANAEHVKSIIASRPEWAHVIDIPRKWFWQPHDGRNINIKRTDVDASMADAWSTSIPSIYAIVADYVDDAPIKTIDKKKKLATIMGLCNELNHVIDANDSNFIFSTDKNGNPKLIIIDTEPFPTMVGMRQACHFANHNQWLSHLVSDCGGKMFCRTKRNRTYNKNIMPIGAEYLTSRRAPLTSPITIGG